VPDGFAALLSATTWAIIGYFFLVNLAQATLLVGSALELRSRKRDESGPVIPMRASPLLPRVTILVPAYNEESMIAQTVTSAMSIDYPDLEVIVVNDGSNDGTLETLVKRFDMAPARRATAGRLAMQRVRAVYASRSHPSLLVVDKDNGGKADALNAAIDHASGALVCAVDADTVIEPDALRLLVRPFLEDERTIAAGGTIRVVNGCRLEHARVVEMRSPRNPLAAIQAVEYPRAFLFGRLGWNRLGGNVIISGAFGLFDRELVIASGGYAADTVGEDMELVLRLRRAAVEAGRDHVVSFLADPVAWTEAPEQARTLARQRNRWHRGLADVMSRHRRMIGRRRYGPMGMIVLPYYLFIELLAPVVELVGAASLVAGLAFGVVDLELALLFVAVAYGMGLVLTLAALLMEQLIERVRLSTVERSRQLAWAVVEQLGYRQATVVWRLWGLAAAVRGDRRWGAQARRGFDNVPETA
jgi:cellulose synthase/poly-beta-1,6-N-acetylglucosamine synthase-like glycosyltransferase